MIGEVNFHQLLVQPMARIIEIHRDFFEDDFFLGGEILDANRRAQQMRKMFHRPVGEFGKHVGVISRHFLRGERIIFRAQLVEDAVDVFPGIFARSLEHHVFEEVRDAVDVSVRRATRF